jgi:septal ring factor EnvC (AmiA/AmiB activator)
MVDVKLDVGDTPSLKAAYKKDKESGNICCFLLYLLIICTVTVLAMDAAELVSLGIVKNVMGLKVMKVEEFTKMNAVFETGLAEKKMKVTTLSAENDGLRNQVIQVTDERNSLTSARDDKENQINAVTAERDALAGERDSLKKQVEDVTSKISDLKQKATTETTDKA